MRHTRLASFTLGGLLMLTGCAGEKTYEQRLRTILAGVDRGVARGPFRADWDSLTNYKVPEWYQDAKFGIFIHWGVYSVPAHGNEWYPRNMYLETEPEFQYHVKKYGPQAKFGYKDFIPRFTADRFDADRWALLFRQAGAKFVVPVAEHHDGFPLYDCSLTDWSAVKMGPRRDVIGLLAGAIRRHGMVFGASSHRAEHWWFFEGGMQFPSDVKEPRFVGLYGPAFPRKTGFGDESQPSQDYLDDWLARTAELVEKYRPQLLWFDWWIEQPVFEPYRRRFAAYYYNRTAQWGREPVINYKNASFPEKAAVLDIERGQFEAIRPQFWQTDTSISKKSWGYIENDEFKSPDSIVDDLVDIVSKNGALLLNIGPRGRDHTRRGPADLARDRPLAGGQRRGDLRYPPLEDLWRGADPGGRGQFQGHRALRLHQRGLPFHNQGKHTLCDRSGLAAGRPAGDQVPGVGA
ncbi:MAG: alpha-L-fucosidase [Bryobacteraceae bacterium]